MPSLATSGPKRLVTPVEAQEANGHGSFPHAVRAPMPWLRLGVVDVDPEEPVLISFSFSFTARDHVRRDELVIDV